MQICILQTRIHIFCLIPRLSKQKNTFNCNVLSSNNLGDQMATTKVSKSFFKYCFTLKLLCLTVVFSYQFPVCIDTGIPADPGILLAFFTLPSSTTTHSALIHCLWSDFVFTVCQDFESFPCLYEACLPQGIQYMYCGNNHNMCNEGQWHCLFFLPRNPADCRIQVLAQK